MSHACLNMFGKIIDLSQSAKLLSEIEEEESNHLKDDIVIHGYV